MDILAELNREDGITVLVSLHQVEYALKYCPRTIALKDGVIAYDGPSRALTPEFLGEIYGAESSDLFASLDLGTAVTARGANGTKGAAETKPLLPVELMALTLDRHQSGARLNA